MKNKKSRVKKAAGAFVGVAFIVASVNAQSDNAGTTAFSFASLSYDARSIAMGGASAAMADGIYGVVNNPAALAAVTNRQGANCVRPVLLDVGGGLAAFAMPIGQNGVVAGNLLGFSEGSVQEIDVDQQLTGITYYAGGGAGSVTWAQKLRDYLFVGASVKGLYHRFSATGNYAASADGAAWTLGRAVPRLKRPFYRGRVCQEPRFYGQFLYAGRPQLSAAGLNYGRGFLRAAQYSVPAAGLRHGAENRRHLMFRPAFELALYKNMVFLRGGFPVSQIDIQHQLDFSQFEKSDWTSLCLGLGLVTAIRSYQVTLDVAYESHVYDMPPSIAVSGSSVFKMRIVFLGSSGFGVPAFDAMAEAGHGICGVVSTPAKPCRGLNHVLESAVAGHARQRNFTPLMLPADLRDRAFIEELKGCKADCFVVVAFRLLPEAVFSVPPLGTFNIHASLLPRFRGPAPIQRAIAAGEQQTGVTIFRIDRGVDTGNIVLQKALPISENETTPQLEERLSRAGAQLCVEALGLIERKQAVYQHQDVSQATAAPKLLKSEAHIDWLEPARTIHNKVRAFQPFPGTYTIIEGRRMAVITSEPVADTDQNSASGTICAVSDTYFEVQCGRGRLRVLRCKPEGGREMDAAAFMRGHPLKQGLRCA